MKKDYSVNIIIPAYNEEGSIKDVIKSMQRLYLGSEILVVDDGSTDRTAALAKETGVKVISHNYNKGYGAAIKTGIKNVSGEIIVLFDADGQHNSEDIVKLLRFIYDYDMVVGERSHYKCPFSIKIGRFLLNRLANYLSGIKIPDVNSGFRIIKKNILIKFMYVLPDTFSFTTTISLAMIKGGYKIKFVPVQTSQREYQKSKVNFIKDGSRTIISMLRIIMLFDPCRVFLPISICLTLYALIELLVCSLLVPTPATIPVFFLISLGLLTFILALLAVRIFNIRRGFL